MGAEKILIVDDNEPWAALVELWLRHANYQELYFARTGGQKEAMLFELPARSPFMIAAWHGQWRTDMFTVPNELWQRCLADLEARRRKKPKRR